MDQGSVSWRLDRPLRILVIAPTGFFADYGCHVRIRGQMAALADLGHTIRIVTYPSGREVDGLKTIRPPLWPQARTMPVGSSYRKLFFDALLLPTALAAAQRFPGGKPDIIHAYLHEGALIGSILARHLRRPLVFDFQGSLTAEMLDHRFISPTSSLLPPLCRLEGWIDHQPQRIMASSSHAAGLLVDRYRVAPGRVVGLPDSVEPRDFRPSHQFPAALLDGLRRRLGLSPNRPVIVYLGLLATYQGIDRLLDALSRLRDQQHRPFCLIMGFPNVQHYQRQAEQLGLADHVLFTGAIPYETAPTYLALGDLAVAPKLSDTEGSGKLLTYMAAALPVVAFDTPVQREYLGDLGFYAAAGDSGALATAIVQAIKDPNTANRRASLLRAKTIQQYTWHHAARQIEHVYRQLLNRWQMEPMGRSESHRNKGR
ncbi:MAG: glycosyltransferase family 4 protein [Chloroflexota bacterium]|nr:glycosyltransferase family 4 protein [Chloroflexota bacterium]